ncbi:hypothetical protein EYC84_003262 [Monilinia fructicola]|uniref:Uncharacterized protein n=1 Tax=Monilinia fructicola TaxID=38448 RepID=A0A5M9JT34_MONFR|nr:hypothetical protein EYC84_003262 [Monilinia fructicola]
MRGDVPHMRRTLIVITVGILYIGKASSLTITDPRLHHSAIYDDDDDDDDDDGDDDDDDDLNSQRLPWVSDICKR